MRKQVAFEVITGTVTPENKQDFLNRINTYIANGWEVLTTAIPTVNSSSVSVAVTLVKYEESLGTPTYSGESQDNVVKRGPGRPPKDAS